MLSRFSSVSSKRLLISVLQRLVGGSANSRIQAPSSQIPVASEYQQQHSLISNFSTSNNYNISGSRAYSTNYFKPISPQSKSRQHQDKIISMLKGTDSFVQTLEMLDSFWTQCSDSNKANGLYRLSRLPRERFQLRLHDNRDRIKGLYDKVLQDVAQIPFNPKELTQIQDFILLVDQNFHYMINHKEIEVVAQKVKEAIENPKTQISQPLKSNEVVEAFWKKTQQNQGGINVTPRLTIGLLSALRNIEHPLSTIQRIYNFYAKHCENQEKEFQLRDSVQLFKAFSDLSSRFPPRRNEYNRLQQYLVQNMENLEENDVIDILNAFVTSRGKILPDLPQNLYKFLNLGIKHNSNTYSYIVIQRLISLIPRMVNSTVKPNNDFIRSLLNYIMNRANNEFNTKRNILGSRMLLSLGKIANQYNINQPQIAHFLLDSSPCVRLSFTKIDQIQELTLCFQRYIKNRIDDSNLRNELTQKFNKEFMKLSSNKQNPSQGDFIKRIIIANILNKKQHEAKRIEQFKEYIEQIQNAQFLLDNEVLKFLLNSRYSSDGLNSLSQLIFSKDELIQAFKSGSESIQWNTFLFMHNKNKKGLFPQKYRNQIQEYFSNISVVKQHRLLKLVFSEKRYNLMNEDIYSEILKIIKRIEKKNEGDNGIQAQQLNNRINFLEMLNSIHIGSNKFQSKRFIIEFLNNEIASHYSNLNLRNKAKLFAVMRNLHCPQSIRKMIANQFETEITQSDANRVNSKLIGYMIQEYTNYVMLERSEVQAEKYKNLIQYIAKFTSQIKEVNEVFKNENAAGQRRKMLNSINFNSEKDQIIQNCTDIQNSLGRLRKYARIQIQQADKESENYSKCVSNLKQIEQMVQEYEQFYLNALKFDNPNHSSLVKFLASILEMDVNSWSLYQKDPKYRQEFDKEILKKNQQLSFLSWQKIFERYQKIAQNWSHERFYNLKHYSDPRKNLMNEFATDYLKTGPMFRPDKNAGLLRLISIGKIKNTNYLNSFLTNLGEKYQFYNQSQLLSIAESLGQLGISRHDIFEKLIEDFQRIRNPNLKAHLFNKLISVGARSMSRDEEWLKKLAELHTTEVFEHYMSNDSSDLNLTSFLQSAYLLFKHEGFQIYETLIPKVFQKFAQGTRLTPQFNRNFSAFFVHRMSQNTNYIPENLKIPDLKMLNKANEDFTLKKRFAQANMRENFNYFKNEIFIRNWNINQVVLNSLNSKGEEVKSSGMFYFRDKVDISVPQRDLGIVIHGMKDYCFDGQTKNHFHLLRHQEALASNIKNVVFLEWPDFKKINSKEDFIQFLSAKLK